MNRWGRSRRSAAALVTATLLVATVAWAATQSEGREGTLSTTNDGGAWLLNQDRGAIGHLNRQVREITAGIRVAEPGASFDVDQAPGIILVHDQSAGRLLIVDDRTHQSRGELQVPVGLTARAVAGGAVLYTPSPLTVWQVDLDTLLSTTRVADLPPTYSASASGHVAVDQANGRTTIYSAEDHAVRQLGVIESRPLTVEGLPVEGLDDPLGLSVVGQHALIWNDSTLSIVDSAGPISLALTGPVTVQQPGLGATGALVTTEGHLIILDLESGETVSEIELDGAQHLPPLVHDGCVFTVASNPPTYAKVCGGVIREQAELTGAGPELRLRLVNGWVWVNDIQTGGAWMTDADTPLDRIDDWGAAFVSEELSLSDATVDDGSGIEESRVDPDSASAELIEADRTDDDGENDAPIAVDDIAVTGIDRPVVVRVLANDIDADGDPLLVDEAAIVDGSDAQIWLTADSTAVQVTPQAGFSGRVQFSYLVSDGRGGSDTATAMVTVEDKDDESNEAPTLVTDVTTARAGQPVSVNVLANDFDPDGDSLTLMNISADTGSVVFDPSGTVTFTPDTTLAAARIELTYTASDDFGATADGRLIVNVRLADTNSPPDARHDTAVTRVGNPASLSVLANDTDPDGDRLFVARRPELIHGPSGEKIEGGALAELVSLTVDGEFLFFPTGPGTHVFAYLISDGQSTDSAQIRVEVSPAGENRPPLAIRDDVVIPLGESRLVRVLDNDGDPDGDVVGIVDWSGSQGLTIEDVPGIGFLVTAGADAPTRAVFRYSISDGVAESVSAIVVVSTAHGGLINQPPILKDDQFDIRSGRTTTLAVLANDHDPEGSELRIQRTSESTDPAIDLEIGPLGQTLAVTVPNGTTGTVDFSYDAADPDDASSSAVVRVRVIGPAEPNRPPIARRDTGRTTAEQQVNIAVLANDSDPDGDELRVESIATQPVSGSATIEPDGTISYEPTAGFAGTDRMRYVVIDTEGDRSIGHVQIGVAPRTTNNRPPSANDDLFRAAVGSALLLLEPLVNDTDPENDPLTIVDVAQPSLGVLTLDAQGAVSYVPPTTVPPTTVPAALSPSQGSDALGQVTFVYVVSDGHGNFDDAIGTIVLEPPGGPTPPLAIDDSVGPTRGNRTVSVDVLENDTDPDGTTADLTVSSQDPDALVVNNRIRIAVGTESGQYVYTITDPDGLTDQGLVSVLVVENEAPVVSDLAAETAFETAAEFRLGTQVDDPDDDPLFFTCCDRVVGGRTEVLQSSNGELEVRFVPTNGFTGEASFSYEVDDQAGHVVAGRVAIEVQPEVNRPPIASNGRLEIEAGTTVPLDLAGLVTDPDADESLLFTIEAVGPFDAAVVGSIATVTSPLDAGGEQGQLRFTVADSRGQQASASVAVTITDVEAEPPTAIADLASTRQGQAIDISILANDVDPLGQGLVIAQLGATTAGKVELSADGRAVRYTPKPDFFGSATFSYTLRDSANTSSRQSVGLVTVVVIGRPAAPAPPTADADNAFAIVGWTAPTGNGAPVDRYELELRSTNGAASTVALGVQNSYRWTGLINGDEYQFRLRAHNEAGWGEWSGWSLAVRPDATASAPAIPAVAFADGELRVAWQTPTNPGSPIVGYKLEIGGGLNQVTTVGPTTTHVWRGLSNGVEYQFRIAAVNGAGDSDWSGWSATEHPLGSPIAPAAPVISRGNRYLDLDWTEPDDNGDPIIEYQIERRSSGQTTSLAGGATDHRWPNLTNGIAQEFRIRAINRATSPGQWSAWSAPVTPCSVPDAPIRPTVVRGDEQVTVSWIEPEDQGCAILSFNVRGNGSVTHAVGAGSTNHVFAGLVNGSRYTFEIQAINEEGGGDWSPVSVQATPAGPPTAPTIDAAQPTAVGAVAVAWSGATPNGSAIGRYELSINGGNPLSVSGPTHTETGLANNSSYDFRVRACNVVACGPWSGVSTATTWGTPSAPLAASASGGNTTFQFSWSAPADNGGSPIIDYRYETIDANGVGTAGYHPASSTRLLLTGRQNGVSIDARVRACNVVGCGPWSSAEATPTAPPPVVSISVGAINPSANCASTCRFVRVVGSDFTPGSTVNIVCHSTFEGAFSSNNPVLVDSGGSLDANPCFFGYPGETVWVVVDGVTSNSVLWP